MRVTWRDKKTLNWWERECGFWCHASLDNQGYYIGGHVVRVALYHHPDFPDDPPDWATIETCPRSAMAMVPERAQAIYGGRYVSWNGPSSRRGFYCPDHDLVKLESTRLEDWMLAAYRIGGSEAVREAIPAGWRRS